MKKAIVLMAMLAIAGSASASIDWLTSATSSDWFTAANWSNGVPSLTNLTNTRTYQTHQNFTYMPIIESGQNAEAWQLDLGGDRQADFPGSFMTVTVNAGGALAVGDYLRVGSGSGSIRWGKLFVNDGTVTVGGTLYVGYGTAAADVRGWLYLNGGTINTNNLVFGNASGTSGMAYITAGTLNANTLTWRPNGTTGTPTTLLDISGSGKVVLAGDQVDAVLAAIDNGWVKSNGEEFSYDWVSYNGVSTTLVPEPATLCLLGLGALSLIRRK